MTVDLKKTAPKFYQYLKSIPGRIVNLQYFLKRLCSSIGSGAVECKQIGENV